MNYKLQFVLAFFSLIYLPFIAAQKTIPIIRGDKFPVIYVDEKGNERFRLPMGHYPSQGAKVYRYSSVGNNTFLVSFKDDMELIRTPGKKSYVINAKNEKVLNFGADYLGISSFQEGLYSVQKKEADAQGRRFTYLDAQGKLIKKDWYLAYGTSFSEGLAAVRLEKDQPYVYIDSNGAVAVEIKDYSRDRIKDVSPFSDGLSRIALRVSDKSYGSEWVFINRQGNTVLNVSALFPEREITKVSDCLNGIIQVRLKGEGQTGDIAFIDKFGTIVFEEKQISSSGYSNGIGYVIQSNTDKSGTILEKSILFNKAGKAITLNLTEGQELKSILAIHENFLLVKVRLHKQIQYAIHRVDNLEQLFISPYEIRWYNDSHIFLRDYLKKHYLLVDYENNIIWETDPETLEFTNISKALNYKDRVRYYKLYQQSDFENGLFELSKLEKLTISGKKIDTLPEMLGSLKTLKDLEIKSTKKLYRLPKSIATLPALSNLKISRIEHKLEHLEYIIKNAPALKEVSVDYSMLEQEFIEQMKTERPNLRITVKQLHTPPPPIGN